MKNKTIFVILCVILLLLLTSSGSGGKIGPPLLLEASGWQEDVPCQSPGTSDSTSNANLMSFRNSRNIRSVVFIRFGNYNLFLGQHKSESAIDKKSKTFSSKK